MGGSCPGVQQRGVPCKLPESQVDLSGFHLKEKLIYRKQNKGNTNDTAYYYLFDARGTFCLTGLLAR